MLWYLIFFVNWYTLKYSQYSRYFLIRYPQLRMVFKNQPKVFLELSGSMVTENML